MATGTTDATSRSAAHSHPGVELPSNLAEAFLLQARARPERPAFSCDGRALTYAELDQASNRLANLVAASVSGQGKPVGLLLNEEHEFLLALLGVLKTGHYYVPIDPELPESVLAGILSVAGCELVLGNVETAGLCGAAASCGARFVSVADAAAYSASFVPPYIAPADRACLALVPSPTAEPRAVVYDHGSVLDAARCFDRCFELTPEDRQSLLEPPGSFGAQRDIFNALVSGATLVHYPLRARGPFGLADWVDAQGITVLCCPASILRHVVQGLPEGRVLHSVRLLECGGEPLMWTDVDRFRRHLNPGCRLFCGLSMAETNLLTQGFVDPEQPRSGPKAPIGRPVPGKTLLVLDESGQPAAPGEAGEILVRSEFIPTGYLGEPPGGESRFRLDQIHPGLVEFRTGHLARLSADGELEHCGQCDPKAGAPVERASLSELYCIDRATGLRRARPGATIGAATINSLGFRGPEMPVAKQPDTLRIAFLGNADTFDPGVSGNESTWAARTCEALREKFNGARFDYVNAGLDGYDVRKAQLQYRNFVARLSPDIVVICLNDVADLTARLARKEGLTWAEARPAGRLSGKLLALSRALRAFSEAGKLDVPAETVLAESSRGIEALVRECQAAGSRVLLVENGRQLREGRPWWRQLGAVLALVERLPWLSVSTWLRLQREHVRALEEIARRTGCAFKDLSAEVPGTARHWADGWHHNDEGSRVFGEAVAEELSTLVWEFFVKKAAKAAGGFASAA